MGSSMSEAQEKLIATFAHVVLFLDGDQAGREGAATIAGRLTKKVFVRVIDLPEGTQPDQLSSEEIEAVLGKI